MHFLKLADGKLNKLPISMITISHIFYNQHKMLSKHFEAWSKHPKNIFKYVIIDDCSPKRISKTYKGDNLSIVRVKQNIPWNIAGARNLGFYVAPTEWVLGADIDHVVTPEAAEQLLSLDLGNPNVAYIFSRVSSESNGYEGCPTIINILMNKNRFFEIGGYDEDFSGNYGKEETFFSHCFRRHSIKLIKCDNIVLNWYADRGGTHGFKRDKTVNSKLYKSKMIELNAGTYRNGPIIRFKWNKIQ